jgi:hypothetical protein
MKREICLVIDKLTDCIEEISTGEKKETALEEATLGELQKLNKRWLFDWGYEYQFEERKIYKLLIKNDTVIQGLVSLELRDGHLEMHLIESAPHNLGAKKKFTGVAGNFIAFVCKLSFEVGCDGNVGFHSKTNLIKHYESTVGAKIIYGNRMGIYTVAAKRLVNLYFKDFSNERRY